MKLLQSIRNLSKRTKIVASAVVLTGLVAVPLAVNAGFFPGRATYDYNKFDPNNLNCLDPNNPAAQNGRCGSMNGPVFNSFVNTPSYGDERYFVDGRRTDQAPSATADTIRDVTEGSRQVLIRLYVHNNANQNTNASGVGVAHNTKVSVELPTVSGSALQAVGAISADNSAPHEVSDTVYMTANRKFRVQYVPGSAKLLRGTQSYPLSDSIVSGGAPIGYNQMDGNLPGCFDYAALVEVVVNIIPEESNNIQLVKQVKNVGDNGWKKEVNSKPGQEEQWLLSTKNIGLDTLTEVQVRDILPPHLSLVPGSVKIVNADQKSYPQADSPLFGNGLGLGTYPSGSGRYVMFKTKALDDFSGCSVRVRNVAKAKSTQTPNEVQDWADVIITKENCKVQPTFACDMLSATKVEGRTVTLTAKASASNGATIKQYRYNFGDNTPELLTDKNVVQHTYVNAGQYAARVTVDFNVNGKVQSASGEQCAVAVTIPTTPVTPIGPASLPSTGPGEVIGIFAAVSAAGAIAHRWILGRRFGNQ